MDRMEFLGSRESLAAFFRGLIMAARANDVEAVVMMVKRREQWAGLTGNVVRYIINEGLEDDAINILSWAHDAREELEKVWRFGFADSAIEMATTVSLLEVFARVGRLRLMGGRVPGVPADVPPVPQDVPPVSADVPQDVLRLFGGNKLRFSRFFHASWGAAPKDIARAYKENGTITPEDEKGIPTTLYEYLDKLNQGFRITSKSNFQKAFKVVFFEV